MSHAAYRVDSAGIKSRIDTVKGWPPNLAAELQEDIDNGSLTDPKATLGEGAERARLPRFFQLAVSTAMGVRQYPETFHRVGSHFVMREYE